MKVFIAQSLDGFIAGPGGALDHLEPFSDNDYGFDDFLKDVDAVVMGRNTFDAVYGSHGWMFPAHLPGVVITSRPLPEGVPQQVQASNNFHAVIDAFPDAYVDGGQTISAFHALGAVKEARIFTLPLLLGQGIRLFPERAYGVDEWSLEEVKTFACGSVLTRYRIIE